METINNTNSNILDQLVSYNSEDLDEYIISLNQTLNEQNNLNNILKNKNHNDNIEYINNFISRNKNQIDYQVNQIKEITEKINNIYLENKELENEKEEYLHLINSKECIDIANKLNEIKKLKNNMKIFLSKHGIHQ